MPIIRSRAESPMPPDPPGGPGGPIPPQGPQPGDEPMPR
jgi:hypothetical protein